MIFGMGSAAIFYVTTGQCYHDAKAAFTKECDSGSGSNHLTNGEEEANPMDERQLLLEQGGSIRDKKAYGS